MNILDIFRRARTAMPSRIGMKKRLRDEESKMMKAKGYQLIEAHPKCLGHPFKSLPRFIITGQNRLQSIEYTRRITARFLKESRVFAKTPI
jgi:hypothetical protein